MSKNNKSLQDIIKNYQNIEMKIIDSEGVVDDELESLLSLNELELGDKLDGYEKFVRYLKGQINYLKNMEELYVKRRKILDNSIKRCKESMVSALSITDKNNIKTKEFNFSLGKSEKWEVDDSIINQENKDQLIKDGLAESLFKIHLNKIKNVYKDDKDSMPDWININENLFIRVS